jgi:hypothetical protein
MQFTFSRKIIAAVSGVDIAIIALFVCRMPKTLGWSQAAPCKAWQLRTAARSFSGGATLLTYA